MKADVEIPFEEILEKAKAGDPKAQTEVRTSHCVCVGGDVLECDPSTMSLTWCPVAHGVGVWPFLQG